jgi:pimeloyl-ACP methyl ester carboxylesterase
MPAAHPLALTEHLPVSGPDGSPLVVLVHGSLDRAASFTRVIRRLDDLHTVAYDRRGYYRSRHALPLNTTLDGHIDDLLAVVGGRPSVVVGHSYGGDIALGAALRGGPAAGIVSVVAYEPPMPWLGAWARGPDSNAAMEASGTGNGQVAGVTGPMAGQVAAPVASVASGPPDHVSAAEAAERFFRRMVGDASWERLSAEAKAERWADGPALEAELAAIRTRQAPFDITTLAVPATFGRGERSAPRHRETVGWLSEHVRDAELVEIAGATHGAHLTHPDAFAAMIRSAMARAGHGVGSPR